MQDPDFITIKTACAIVGGDKPISEPTYYRGVKAGRLPAPEHPNSRRVAHPSRKAHCDAEQGGRMTYAATHKAERLTAAIDSLEPSEAVSFGGEADLGDVNVRHVRQAQAGTTKKRPKRRKSREPGRDHT